MLHFIIYNKFLLKTLDIIIKTCYNSTTKTKQGDKMRNLTMLQNIGTNGNTNFYLTAKDRANNGVYVKDNSLYVAINIKLDNDEVFGDYYNKLLKDGNKFIEKEEATDLLKSDVTYMNTNFWTNEDKELFVSYYNKLLEIYKANNLRELDAYIAFNMELDKLKVQEKVEPKKVIDTITKLLNKYN